MEFLVDAQLPPALARFLREVFGVDASHVDDLGHRESSDSTIARLARERNAVVVSKDEDFFRLARMGEVPGIVYVTCGNVTNAVLFAVFRSAFPAALELLERGETIVEISRTGNSRSG